LNNTFDLKVAISLNNKVGDEGNLKMVEPIDVSGVECVQKGLDINEMEDDLKGDNHKYTTLRIKRRNYK
jgi:hypothetical protein